MDDLFVYRTYWCSKRVSERAEWAFRPTTQYFNTPWGDIAMTTCGRMFIDLNNLAKLVAPGEAKTIMANARERDGENFTQWLDWQIPAAEKDLVRQAGSNKIFVPLMAAERWLQLLADTALPAFDFADMRFGISTVLEETFTNQYEAQCAKNREYHAARLCAARGIREPAE